MEGHPQNLVFDPRHYPGANFVWIWREVTRHFPELAFCSFVSLKNVNRQWVEFGG
jgi:hypothetical protein